MLFVFELSLKSVGKILPGRKENVNAFFNKRFNSIYDQPV